MPDDYNAQKNRSRFESVDKSVSADVNAVDKFVKIGYNSSDM